MLSHFPNVAALARHCVLTTDGELGFLDRKGRMAVDPVATGAFLNYSQQLLHEYNRHPMEGGMHLGVVLENDGKRPWKGLTMRLSDGLLRRVYGVPNQKSTGILTRFQTRNQWQSIYRGLELLFEYRVESMPDTPVFCPVILYREIDAATRAVLLESGAEAINESVPLLEFVNFVSLMTDVDKKRHTVEELIQKIFAGVIHKSLRKSSGLDLIDEEQNAGSRQQSRDETNPSKTAPTSAGIRMAHSQQIQQITLERLREYHTFSRLTDESLVLLAGRMAIVNLHLGDNLFERNSSDNYAYFLLEGTVELEAADKRVQVVTTGDAPAKRPLSHLRPRQFTVRALDEVKFLRVDYDLATALPDTVDKNVGAGSPASWIFDLLYEDISQQGWVLATIPALTRRVLQLMEQKPADTARLAELLALDPVAAAKVLTAANRQAGPGGKANRVTTLQEAITLLQSDSVLSLVRQIVDQDHYEVRDKTVRERLERLWRHSLDVACISHMLAQLTLRTDPERALVHGLIHDIGMYAILKYADKQSMFTITQGALERVLTSLHGWVGGIILKEWGLPEEFITTNIEADDWYRNRRGPVDYCDLVVLAQLHHFVGTPMGNVVPTIDMVPVSSKVSAVSVAPLLSLDIRKQARRTAKKRVRLLSA